MYLLWRYIYFFKDKNSFPEIFFSCMLEAMI